jgi:hypothetical protein
MLTPPTLPPERVVVPPDPETLNRVVENIQKLAAGNGVRREDIVLDAHKAELFTFGARSYVRLVSHHSTRTLAGAHMAGEKLGSLDTLTRTVAGRANAVRLDPSSRALVLRHVDARPDKGFGVRDVKFFVPELAKEYAAEESCKTCGASGTVACGSCGGRRQQNCMSCHGRKLENCPVCRGTRQTMVGGKPEACRSCQARGQIPCRSCKGSGTVACALCKGAGAVSCRACNGAKIISHIATTQIEAHIHFDYDRGGMTTAAVKMMDGKGAAFAAGAVAFEIVAQPNIPADEPADIITRDFTAHIPAGKVMMRIKGRKLTVEFAGLEGTLVESPPFLDILTRSGQTALKKAAEGQGDAAGLLLQAARFKLLREILQVAAKTGAKSKGLNMLVARYPVGIGRGRLQSLLQLSDQALSRITKKPRIIGGLCGFVMGAGIGFYAAPFVATYQYIGYAAVIVLVCLFVVAGVTIAAKITLNRLSIILKPAQKTAPTGQVGAGVRSKRGV